MQVKRNTGTISLGAAKAHVALENFWILASKDIHRKIEFHYLTTSLMAMEKDAKFGSKKGIDVWRAAQTNTELANEVTEYLITKLDTSSLLMEFLTSATPEIIQERLIRRFHWLTDQPGLDVVKRSVDDRIAVLLSEQRRALSLIPNVRKFLESRFWELILEPSSDRRCLTLGELLRQFEAATTTYLPVPVDRLVDLISNANPGLGLFNLLLEKAPCPPEPLLRRPELILRLETLVTHRKVVLITGTVHKGKTTVAQLVCSTLCPEAWWINLTGRQFDQIDNIFMVLSNRIDKGDCPSLVIIDDLDLSHAAHQVYKDSLALVFHRAKMLGRGIILTAQGGTSDSAIVQEFKNVELLEVPELSSEETEALCIEHGCPIEISGTWGFLITAWTKGHPKLVQVRLSELSARNWPIPDANEISTQSLAVTSARQMARQLLRESASGPIAELVYLISECSVLMHRSIAIRLAETIDGLINAGDIIDNLTGKWLERIDGQWFRTTELIKGVAVKVWSPEKYKWAHILLHDAIKKKNTLNPSEAAALLFHAFIGGEPLRLALTAIKLQIIDNIEAKQEIERQLLWLPFVAIESGQAIVADATAGAALRGLQFRVASTIDAEVLPQICALWADEINKIPHPELMHANQAMRWLSIGFSENRKVPLQLRLEAIMGIPTLNSEILEIREEYGKKFSTIAKALDGFPEDGTMSQAILLCAGRTVCDLNSLEELLQWLDNIATQDIRQEFEAMLEWPIVQTLGAFIQGAWSAFHEQTKDWEPWIDLLERVNDYAKRRDSPRFGREAAKAKATILTEYLGRDRDALTVIDEAEETFGISTILMEQRANVLYQVRDDESVLEIWSRLTSDAATISVLDPFAYRRAGISAARLKQWDKSAQIFRAAANSIQPGSFELTKFGLQIDAALAISLGGDQAIAAKILADAVLSLPPIAAKEGDERWEAVQRAAATVCNIIENSLWKNTKANPRLEPGNASSPELKVEKAKPGQAARSEMLRAQSLHLILTILKDPPELIQELELLASSKFFSVRWIATEARLAMAYSMGTGSNFVEALLAFDKASADLSENIQQGRSLITADDGPKSNPPTVAPERWFGLLCAGVICAGANLNEKLEVWCDESSRLLGREAILTKNIRSLQKGASLSSELLLPSIVSEATPPPLRFGAAAQLLRRMLTAEETLKTQALLTSALVSDISFSRQALFNREVARCFAGYWRTHAQNSFQFYAPKTSVPILLDALDGVEHGNGTLKNVLVSAASALRQPLGEFMSRVL